VRGERTQCVVVTREARHKSWEFMVRTEKMAVAVESARQTQDQEHVLGNPRFEAKAMKASDWEAGRIRAKVK
jgi:hypothetical protein